MQTEPAGRATALSYLQVVFAAVGGVLIFGTVPGVWTFAGTALILVSAYINIRDRSTAKESPVVVKDSPVPRPDP
jgi:drug/metabolite transporter (DMT)-like permease